MNTNKKNITQKKFPPTSLKILFTGESGVGKTTTLVKLLKNFEERNFTVLGFATRKINNIIYFYDLSKEDEYKLWIESDFNKDTKIIAKVNDFMIKETNIEIFNNTGVRLLRQINELASSQLKKTVIVLDEIGRIEDASPSFRKEIIKTIKVCPYVIGVLKMGSGLLIDEVKSSAEKNEILVEGVCFENQQILLEKIVC